MDDTLKTVLVVGVVAAGVYFVMQRSRPGAASATHPASTSKPADPTAAIAGDISAGLSLATSIFGAFGSGDADADLASTN